MCPPPILELMMEDEDEDIGNLPLIPHNQGSCGHASMGSHSLRWSACHVWTWFSTNTPYHSAETLILEDDSSSLDNNCSHSSGSDSSGFKSPEDDDLDEPIPTYQMSQKMAYKVQLAHHQVLISWLMVIRDPLGHLVPQRALWRLILQHCTSAPLTTPTDSMPSSTHLDCEPSQSQYHTDTQVHSEDLHQSANADTTSKCQWPRGTHMCSTCSALTPGFKS